MSYKINAIMGLKRKGFPVLQMHSGEPRPGHGARGQLLGVEGRGHLGFLSS